MTPVFSYLKSNITFRAPLVAENVLLRKLSYANSRSVMRLKLKAVLSNIAKMECEKQSTCLACMLVLGGKEIARTVSH